MKTKALTVAEAKTLERKQQSYTITSESTSEDGYRDYKLRRSLEREEGEYCVTFWIGDNLILCHSYEYLEHAVTCYNNFKWE